MHTPPPAPDQDDDDSLLNQLVSLTGLFTPEVIWHEEELLDDLDEQEQKQAAGEAATRTTEA